MDPSKLIIFKPLGDGYVYRTPNAWVFGSGRHYLLNEQQKAEIQRTIADSTAQMLWVTGVSWIGLFALLTLGTLASVDGIGHHTLRTVLVWVALIVSLYAALLISRQLLSRRLQPILAIAPLTSERITRADTRPLGLPVVLSPLRQKVLTICLVLMPFLLVAIIVSRAVDMHDATHQPLSETLYSANAHSFWLVAAYCVFWAVALLIRKKASQGKM